MTNAEKFKTAKERTIAFNKTCNGRCDECKIYETKKGQRIEGGCTFAWLEMEAIEETPLPCPFCGGESVLYKKEYSFVKCCDCDAESFHGESPDEAIAAWNRRV